MQMILAASPRSGLQELDIGFDKRAHPATFALTELSTWLDILGHMLMWITLSNGEGRGGCVYRCFQNEARWQEYYTALETSLTLHTPAESGALCCYPVAYVLLILTANVHISWQVSSCATCSFKENLFAYRTRSCRLWKLFSFSTRKCWCAYVSAGCSSAR